jgi:hypothetical protein
MTNRPFLTSVLCLAAAYSATDRLLAAGGTSVVAAKGQATYVSPTWPDGVGELVNDPLRTSGWNPWFTGCPNDVHHYAFEINSTDDLNRLIARLAAIKTDLQQIRLSHLKEPAGLGWATRLPEGNRIPVIFSIGDQARVEQSGEYERRIEREGGQALS